MLVAQMDMKALRERAGLSAEEVAFRLGIAHSTVRNWESGKTEPSLGVTKIGQLIDLYQCNFDELRAAVNKSRAGKIA